MKHLFPLLLLPLLLVAACKPGAGRTASPEEKPVLTVTEEKPVLTVTIEPLRYFTEAVAGDRFRVVSMVPQGSSPETYDPTPAQLMELSHSRAYLRIGYIGFEQVWMKKLAENAPGLPFFDTSRGIDLIRDDTAHDAAEADDSGHHHHGGVEPHVWNSTVNAKIIAGNILGALCTLAPADSTYFRERYGQLCRRIDWLDGEIRKKLEDEEAAHAFIIYHPALSYFARDYGLLQIPLEAGGKEPSPAKLKELIDLGRKERVRVVFVQPEFDQRNAELVAKQISSFIYDINPLSYSWEEEMMRVASRLGPRKLIEDPQSIPRPIVR